MIQAPNVNLPYDNWQKCQKMKAHCANWARTGKQGFREISVIGMSGIVIGKKTNGTGRDGTGLNGIERDGVKL